MLALLLSAALALGADCPDDEAVGPDDLRLLLGAADQAWAELDADAFVQAIDGLQAKMPCLQLPISPGLAAEIHRHVGLRGFLNQDFDASEAAFAAARAIEPEYAFPESKVPPGNPVLELYSARDPLAAGFEVIPAPATGELLFDGRPSETRPLERPVVFQHVASHGTVKRTAYLTPGQALPAYTLVEQPLEPPIGPDPHGPASRGLRKGLTVVAIASGTLAALTWGGSHLSRQRYNGATDPDALNRLRGQTNALSAASAGALAVGVGAGGAAVLVGRF